MPDPYYTTEKRLEDEPYINKATVTSMIIIMIFVIMLLLCDRFEGGF